MKINMHILVFLLTFTIPFNTYACQEQDYIALRALYLSTDGDNWVDNTGWLTTAEFEANPTIPVGTNMDTWYGVTTDNEGCIHRLKLSNNQLNGNIPPEIGNLTSLDLLSLYINQLSGNIPPEIGNLTNLTALQLDGNQLSGNIPPEIGNMNSLDILDIFSNELSGNIPPEIGNLTSLRILQLYNNQLSGSIPPEIGNLGNLEFLSIFNNQLSGCYDPALTVLCSQLLLGGLSDNISSGNDFDASWKDFCDTGAGTCTLDIDNTHQSTFAVYPIPAKDFVIFDVPNIAAADEIILYDISGKQISRQALPQDKELTVSHLNDGVYIYRIFYEDEMYSGKIVVE